MNRWLNTVYDLIDGQVEKLRHRNNCMVWAWWEFAQGRVPSITLRWTFYSAWSGPARSRWWRWILKPISLLFAVIGLLAIQLWAILWNGRWLHFLGGLMEYMPLVSKYVRKRPPGWFVGGVRQAPICPTCGAVPPPDQPP